VTPDRVDLFEADIADSPDALARLLDAWQPVDLGADGRVVFTGLGSSRFAADVVAPLLRVSGRSAWVEIAGDDPSTLPATDVTLIAISASGRTPEVIEAARRHLGRSRVLAVTNRPDSELAAAADHVVALGAGDEAAGIACRTFRATIAVLALATGTSSVDDLRPAVEGLSARLGERPIWAPPLVEALDGADGIDVLAAGSMVGVAEQAALMLREAPRLPAKAVSTTDWLHTGVYLARPGHRLALFPGAGADGDIETVAARRGTILVTIPAGRHDPVARAIVDSIVMECVSADLWRRADALDKAT
jgi:glucosamine--fructose-6-phosphate aminotransferase (isomerizing)